jgi:hypothetical protein
LGIAIHARAAQQRQLVRLVARLQMRVETDGA